MAAGQQKQKKRRNSGDPRKAEPNGAAAPTPAPTTATAASAWVSHVPDDSVEVLALPSGNAARVRHIKPEAFLEQGLIPDPITAIVDKAIKSKKGLRPQQKVDMSKDPEQLGAMLEMMDRTVVFAVVEPTVVMPPECVVCHNANLARNKQHSDKGRDDFHEFVPEPREEGVLYVDRVDMDDKAFIMQWTMGGTRDLERFRREQRGSMASMASQ